MYALRVPAVGVVPLRDCLTFAPLFVNSTKWTYEVPVVIGKEFPLSPHHVIYGLMEAEELQRNPAVLPPVPPVFQDHKNGAVGPL